ncbi:MAG: hypothetical protein HYR55_16905 [Acidobacteria bacterium]|nr:hypothetical protein [Acidobacteriota bacterium]MBI3655783.1 hypothetical protein [Acidobacteriota bacterium]
MAQALRLRVSVTESDLAEGPQTVSLSHCRYEACASREFMALGLLIANVLSWVGLCAAAYFGHLHAVTHSNFRNHFNMAIPAAFLSIFSHSMTFFYFIGMTKQIKDWSARHKLDPAILSQMRSCKSKASPHITAAILGTMAATILGGGAATSRGLLASVHGWLGYIAVAINLLAIIIEYRCLLVNNLLVEDALKKVTSDKN